MKGLLLAAFLLVAIFATFWYQEWRYLLPTPVPENYQEKLPNQTLSLDSLVQLDYSKPVFLHFFSPECPCSKYNQDLRKKNRFTKSVIFALKMPMFRYGQFRDIYCNFLLQSQFNYTCTFMASHTTVSHDKINRFLNLGLMEEKNFYDSVHLDTNLPTGGYLIFDDTVLDKSHSRFIELARKQYSGNAGGVVLGIGVVIMLYYVPLEDKFYLVGYRIFDPGLDHKTKVDHVMTMLKEAEQHCIGYVAVLMDKWYAVNKLFQLIHSFGKYFYCPIKSNRLVKPQPNLTYCTVGELAWRKQECQAGKSVKVKELNLTVRLYKVTFSTKGTAHTNYVLTNDTSPHEVQTIREFCQMRWTIETFNREIKQLSGIDKCQCRSAAAQRTHIYCALLVWNKLKKWAYDTFESVYQQKRKLFTNYLIEQLKTNSYNFAL